MPKNDVQPLDWSKIAGVMPDRRARHKPGTNEAQILKGRMNRDAVARLWIIEGLSDHDIAETLGLTVNTIRQCKKRAVMEYGQGSLDETDRALLISKIRGAYETVLNKSIGLVEDSPAHGALVLKAGEQLLKMHGIEPGTDNEDRTDPAEIAERVRLVSPLIAGRIESAANAAKRELEAEILPKPKKKG